MSISQSNYVNVSFSYQATSSVTGSIPMTIMFGDSASLTEGEKTYNSLTELETDYANTTPVYKAGALYFNNGGQQLVLYPLTSSTPSDTVNTALLKYPNVICVCMLDTTNITIEEMATLLSTNASQYAYSKLLIVATDGSTDTTTPADVASFNNTVLLKVPTADYTPACAISIAGVLSTYDTTSANSLLSLQFEQLVGMDSYVDGTLTASAINQLVSDNYSVMVNVADRVTFLDGARLTNGEPIHSAWGFAVLENNLTTAVFNALLTKLPYSTPSEAVLQNVVNQICNNFVTNGLITTNGIYRGATQSVSYNGQNYTLISENTVLPNGYLVYEIPIANASASDVQNNKIPPIYVFVVINDAIRMVEIIGEVRK